MNCKKTLKCPFNHLENDKIYDNSLYSMLYFSFPKCIKTHIRACRISKFFRESHPDPEHWLEEDNVTTPPPPMRNPDYGPAIQCMFG